MYATMENEKVTQSAVARTGGRRGFAATGHNFAALMRRRMQRASIARQLRALDDRMLSDIGLERWQIDEIAERAVGGTQLPAWPVPAAIWAFIKTSLVQPVLRAYRRHVAFRELAALDDRLLKDIGITRGEIPAVVETLLMTEPGRNEQTWRSRSDHDMAHTLRLWNRSRSAAKELKALDDRMLRDIGIVRGDIDGLAVELAQQSLRKPANRNRKPAAAA